MALVSRFLALILDPYKAKFSLAQYSNPHMKFKDAFQYFLDDYGATTKYDQEENKNKMTTPQTLQDGWLVL